MPKMTPSEAFVETLVAHGVKNVFGIVGSAYMDALDLFPTAGIRFIPTVHEQGAGHMADGYARASGRQGVCIAQNGPGVTNFVTSTAAAYWAHSPVVVVTPETGSGTMGLGGFQETDQLPIFSKITKFQGACEQPRAHGRDHRRAASTWRWPSADRPSSTSRATISTARSTARSPSRSAWPRGPGAEESLDEAADILSKAKFPVILAGGGVIMSDGIDEAKELAEFLQAPGRQQLPAQRQLPRRSPAVVRTARLPGLQGGHEDHCQGRCGAGARHAPRAPSARCRSMGSTTGRRTPRSSRSTAITACSGWSSRSRSACAAMPRRRRARCSHRLANRDVAARKTATSALEAIKAEKEAWEEELGQWTHEKDPWSLEVSKGSKRMHPRQMLRELEKAMPKDAMVSTDIGNICSVSNSYLRFSQPNSMFAAMSFGNCGYAFPTIIGTKVAEPERPAIAYVGDGAWGMSFGELLTCVREDIPVTAVVFNNEQWGAEKKNQVDFYANRFEGVNLKNPSWAEVAKTLGAEGVVVENLGDVGEALEKACRRPEEGQDHRARDAGDEGAGRSLPPRCAEEAQAPA